MKYLQMEHSGTVSGALGSQSKETGGGGVNYGLKFRNLGTCQNL